MEDKEYHNPDWEMKVPHNGSYLGFIRPESGNYIELKKKLKDRVLRMPTLSELVSLVHFCTDNPDFKPANRVTYDIANKDFPSMLADTGFIRGDKGVYIQDSPDADTSRCGYLKMKESELVKKIEAGKKNVRFVPFPNGEKRFYIPKTYAQISKHPLLIGAAGEEGAEKIAKISEKYGKGLNFGEQGWEGRSGIAKIMGGPENWYFFVTLGAPEHCTNGDTYLTV